MKRTACVYALITAFSAAVPLDAQEQDTVFTQTTRNVRFRVERPSLSRLPVDSADRVLRFVPGYFEGPGGATTWRVEGTSVVSYVDGVPLRSLIAPRSGYTPPLNAVASVSFIGGGLPASRTGAASVEYATLAPSTKWTGGVRMLSDAVAPGSWNQHRSRFQVDVTGPVRLLNGLNFAIAAQLDGQRYTQLPDGGPRPYVAVGIDTVITLPRFPTSDSVQVVVPEYAVWDYDRLPLGSSDNSDVAAALEHRARDGTMAVRYYRTGSQRISRALEHLYNPDAWRGREDIAHVLSLQAQRNLPKNVTASATVSHHRYDYTAGILDPRWANANAHPAFGINMRGLEFMARREDYPVTAPLLRALESGVMPLRAFVFLTLDDALVPMRQGVAGVSQSLRLNPYGLRTVFPVSGVRSGPMAALDWASERRSYASLALSRQFGVHRIDIGGEFDRIAAEFIAVPLADGTPMAAHEALTTAAAFLEGQTSLMGVHVSAGARVERFTTNGRLPLQRNQIPDSLLGDAYRIVAGDGPWHERLEPVVDCGGAATVTQRTNPINGAVVCRSNWIPIEARTEVSPRIAVDYARGRFSARASYGSYVEHPRLNTFLPRDLLGVSTSSINTVATEPVRQDMLEVAVRLRTFQDSWIDIQFFHLDIRNPIQYTTGQIHPMGAGFVPRIVNGDAQATPGVEVSAVQSTSWGGITAAVAMIDSESGAPASGATRASGMGWIDLGGLSPILADLTVHATALYTDGLRYTRLANQGNGTRTGLYGSQPGGVPAGPLWASRLPSRKEFDIRVTKGFRIGGTSARFMVDVRNPLGIDNVHTVFAETGSTEHEDYADFRLQEALYTYGGGGQIVDLVIDDLTAENAVNRHMLRRAEQRFGNGDGTFTVAEHTAAVSSWLDLSDGPQYMRDSRRELRLGVEIGF